MSVTYKEIIKNNKSRQLTDSDEDKELIQKAKSGDKKAVEKIIIIHLPLVIGMVNKLYQNRTMSIDDLIGCGNLALLKAIEKYNPDMNTKFSSYAVMWIKQFCNRALEKDNVVNYSGQISNLKIKYSYFVDNYYKEHLEKPTIEQIAKGLKISINKAKLAEQAILSTLSIDYETPDNQSIIQITDNTANPENNYMNNFDLNLLKDALNILDPDARTIIELKFGILNGKHYNLKQISNRLGISYSAIKQIEQESLDKLKEYLLDKGM